MTVPVGAAASCGAPSRSAVSIDHLRVVRGGRTAIDDVSIEVAAGRVTGLLGPSGCGKTTLMRAIVGVQILGGGAVTVLGRPAGDAWLRRRVGYVTQAPAVYLDLTVAENLAYFAAIAGASAADAREAITRVGLSDVAGKTVGTLSGGQQSRVSLATALAHRPLVLVLDEPTVGLDPVLRTDLWAMFHELAAHGTTLLVSSHSMEEAAECDDLILMREGRVLAATTPDELRARTGEVHLTRAFLSIIEERT